MLRTTFKGLVAHKSRLFTTALAVVLGVAFMSGTLVLTDSLGRQLETLSEDTYAEADVFVRSEAAFSVEREPVRAPVDASLVDAVAETDGVEAVAGRVEGWAQIVGSDGEPLGGGTTDAPNLGGNWITVEQLNPFELAEGSAPAEDDQVVIDRGSATEADLAVGDDATVLTTAGPVPVTISGIATFGDSDSMLGMSSVLFTDAAAQTLVGEPGTYSGIAAVAASGVDPASIVDDLSGVVGGDLEVLTGSELRADARSEAAESLSFFNAFLMTFAVIALFVGAFIISNTFSVIVAQRTRELAVLRAIGASRRQVMASVVLESVVVGVLASIGGLLAGLGVALGLRSMLAGLGVELPNGGLVLEASSMLISLAVGVVITVASALLPARRASRIAPIAALRDTAVDDSAGSRMRTLVGSTISLVGAAMLAAGLGGASSSPIALVGGGAAVLFIGVAALGPVLARPVSRFLAAPVRWFRGTPGLLAGENAVRNPKRTAATASALMVGVGLVGFITVTGSSIKASADDAISGSMLADFAVVSGSIDPTAGGFDNSMASDLGQLPEVLAASGLRTAPVLIDDDVANVVSVDPSTVEQVLEFDTVEGHLADLGPGKVALSEPTARDAGLRVGSVMEVEFADGTSDELVVEALFADQSWGDIVVEHSVLESHGVGSLDSEVFVALADGVDPGTGRSVLEAELSGVANASVKDSEEYAGDIAAEIDMLLGLGYALLALAVVIGVLGIANTLALSIMERTRELGLLRAIGMFRSQVRSMVRWESAVIALFGAVLGLAVGIGFGLALVYALADEGINVVVIPVPALAVIAGLAVLAGVGASLLPSRRAARVDVLTALGTS